MKKFVLVFLAIILFNVSFVSAVCEEDQIDINSALVEELDKLYGVGIKIAGYIIESRPFYSIDDLIKVNRIGPVTLSKIKTQGLACVVSEESKNTEEKINSTKKVEQNTSIENTEDPQEKTPSTKEKNSPFIGRVIKLEPKNIKGENVNEKLSREDYAIYGFFVFSILLGVLFAIKKYRFNKNEFG